MIYYDDLLMSQSRARVVTSVGGCTENGFVDYFHMAPAQISTASDRLKTERRAHSTKPRDRRLHGARRWCHLANARRTTTQRPQALDLGRRASCIR